MLITHISLAGVLILLATPVMVGRARRAVHRLTSSPDEKDVA